MIRERGMSVQTSVHGELMEQQHSGKPQNYPQSLSFKVAHKVQDQPYHMVELSIDQGL